MSLESRIGVWTIVSRDATHYNKVHTTCSFCGKEHTQILQNLRRKPQPCKSCGSGKSPVSYPIWEVASEFGRWFLDGHTLDEAIQRLPEARRANLLANARLTALQVTLGACRPPSPIDILYYRGVYSLLEKKEPELIKPEVGTLLPSETLLPPDETPPEETLSDLLDQTGLTPNSVKVRPKFLSYVLERETTEGVPQYIEEFLLSLGDVREMHTDTVELSESEILVSFYRREVSRKTSSLDLE